MIGNCLSCFGRKKIVGLGNMSQDCPHCKGIGYIETVKDEIKSTLKDVMSNPKKIRKKKVVNEPVLQC